MPCYTCGTEFGIFKKEIGCENCGFGFCGKCCKKREFPPEASALQKQVVCNKCYMGKTEGKASATTSASPPLAHKKRMEALKKQSYSVDSSKHAFLQSEWSNVKDKELAERLQKLKRDRIKELPSESEIGERLAKLKGMDPSLYKAPPIEVFRPADRRTSVEKSNDLLKEMTETVELESKFVKPEDEIAARLAKLKSYGSDKPSEEGLSSCEEKASDSVSNSKNEEQSVPMSEEEEIKLLIEKSKLHLPSQMDSQEDVEMNEKEEAKKLVEKFMAGNFDDDMEELDSLNEQGAEQSPSDEQGGSTEEFPWCIICSEDAKIRCFGCDGDLYCLRCFRECHDSLDIKDHKTCPFLLTKQSVL